MYTKKMYPSLFDDYGPVTDYYKDGELIASKIDGQIRLYHFHGPAYEVLTRAKGYRYWEKHFPDRYCWTRPEPLQEALDMAPASRGVFVDRSGQLCGYEG